MSSIAITKQQSAGSYYPAFAMEEKELIEVLRNSLYPGAQDNSIKMVISYCKASNLDPMQKPVHIVPIYDSKAKGMRDVVMPGIGLYRSQASRSGEYAGVSEPEFGEDVTETFAEEKGYEGKTRKAITLTYPKWCRVTVKRLLPNGVIVEFTAKELWKENYATAGKDSQQPNAMWSRRPYAQLAKCSEAQALRKAFPEFGAQPTADEMEGKEIDITNEAQVVGGSGQQKQPPAPEYLPNDDFAIIKDKYKGTVASGKKSASDLVAWIEAKGKFMTDAQKMEVSTWAKPEVIEGELVDDPFVTELEAAEGATA